MVEGFCDLSPLRELIAGFRMPGLGAGFALVADRAGRGGLDGLVGGRRSLGRGHLGHHDVLGRVFLPFEHGEPDVADGELALGRASVLFHQLHVDRRAGGHHEGLGEDALAAVDLGNGDHLLARGFVHRAMHDGGIHPRVFVDLHHQGLVVPGVHGQQVAVREGHSAGRRGLLQHRTVLLRGRHGVRGASAEGRQAEAEQGCIHGIQGTGLHVFSLSLSDNVIKVLKLLQPVRFGSSSSSLLRSWSVWKVLNFESVKYAITTILFVKRCTKKCFLS